MSEIRFYNIDEVAETLLKYAVIVAKYQGRWVYSRHRERTTFEIPGGHIEKGETALEAGKRELYEETGATHFDITPICIYRSGENGYGLLLFAEIETLGELPQTSEIAQIALLDTYPKEDTYPQIHKPLFKKAQEYLKG